MRPAELVNTTVVYCHRGRCPLADLCRNSGTGSPPQQGFPPCTPTSVARLTAPLATGQRGRTIPAPYGDSVHRVALSRVTMNGLRPPLTSLPHPAEKVEICRKIFLVKLSQICFPIVYIRERVFVSHFETATRSNYIPIVARP